MLRLGLLSTANINREILAAAPAVDTLEITAVASRGRARAEEYAREHDLGRAHGSYEDLLADPEIDAVYVPLPNGLHHEWTMRALEAGKHVLCEKPYSRVPAEVEEAFATAESRGLVLMEAFMYRHHPQTSLVSELVRDGSIGRLRTIRATFTFVLAREDDARFDPALAGGSLMDVGCYCVSGSRHPALAGGSLMDVGCYCVSGSRLVAGEPVRVHGEQVVGPSGVDLSFHGTLRFADEVVAQIDCSFVVPRFQRFEAVGEEGTLVVESPWRADWPGEVVLDRGGERQRVDVASASSFERELANFAAAAEGREPPLLGRDDALGQSRAIDALYRSAAEGRAVEVQALTPPSSRRA